MQSTYRLQFHRGFTFNDARNVVNYLGALGITHAYASPYLKASAGSTHGYDVVDPTQLNPEIGSTTDYGAWLAALASASMSHILDTVPNHMGVGSNENPWWNDVLEDGERSVYANYFDIDWDRDPSRKLLLPLLGKTYGQTLEDGELKLAFDAISSRMFISYFERQVPLAPQSVAKWLQQIGGLDVTLVAQLDRLPEQGSSRLQAKRDWQKRFAERLTASPEDARRIQAGIQQFNGAAGHAESFDSLHRLLEEQSYRLASWQTAPERINYRRFFDINGLAALRMEREEVFRDVHALTLQLVDAGKVAGLRVDHPDGLRDPAAYFRRLQQGRAHGPTYVAIEKILAPDESLSTRWAVSGTSGYDFLNFVNGLYIDPAGETPLTRLFGRWSGIGETFAELAIEKKRLVLHRSFQGDLLALARRLEKLVRSDRTTRDLSFTAIHYALGEMVVNFPIYRTYIAAGNIAAVDARRVGQAMEQTLRHAPTVDRSALQLLTDTLLLRWPTHPDAQMREQADDFIAKFQQLTAPVTAKGVEDTAFYVYNRLVSLNEVGNDPGKFGVSPSELHRYLADRQAHWPTALSCLSTHDTKRSEDVRARLNVISEIPGQWEANVDVWGRMNMPLHRLIDGQRAPSGNEEYLFYQSLLGIWPRAGVTEDLIKRLQAYMTKAMREAKITTSWTAPNQAYETAVLEFVAGVLRGAAGRAFLDSFGLFAAQVARLGMMNSISQTIVRLMAPGVPDTYQGTEVIDLSLVDPDNRRAVDYERREHLLRRIQNIAEGGSTDTLAAALRQEFSLDPTSADTKAGGLDDASAGQTKLHVTWRLLQLRRVNPDLFTQGSYVPLRVTGPQADHLFAFARRWKHQTLIVLVPRLMARLRRDKQGLPTGTDAWDGTTVDLTELAIDLPLTEVLTQSPVSVADDRIQVAQALARFPAAVLIS